jgi:hypothetical protein
MRCTNRIVLDVFYKDGSLPIDNPQIEPLIHRIAYVENGISSDKRRMNRVKNRHAIVQEAIQSCEKHAPLGPVDLDHCSPLAK